jgi:hypothetical protein
MVIYSTIFPKYKILLKKSMRLTKCIVVLNLLIIGIIFTILLFKKEKSLIFFLVYLLHITEKYEL